MPRSIRLSTDNLRTDQGPFQVVRVEIPACQYVLSSRGDGGIGLTLIGKANDFAFVTNMVGLLMADIDRTLTNNIETSIAAVSS